MTEMEEMDNAFGSGTAATAQGDNEAKAGGDAARIAELEKELAKERVESGRLKKANEDIARMQEEIARLKAAQRTGADTLARLPDEVKGGIPDDIQRFTGAAIDNAVAEAIERERKRHEEELRGMREATIANSRRAFAQQIKTAYPTFFDDVREGGKLNAAWTQYRINNDASIERALQTQNFNALQYHINRFQQEAEVSIPSGGQGGTAVPDPRSISGGISALAKPGKIYTWAEIDKLYDEIEDARNKEDFNTVKRLSEEIDLAQKEGRVK